MCPALATFMACTWLKPSIVLLLLGLNKTAWGPSQEGGQVLREALLSSLRDVSTVGQSLNKGCWCSWLRAQQAWREIGGFRGGRRQRQKNQERPSVGARDSSFSLEIPGFSQLFYSYPDLYPAHSFSCLLADISGVQVTI